MPKNPVIDSITDQEMAFAHLVLSGTMTDRKAAEAAGLNPDTAAYTKSKPRVRDYMIDHRAAVSEKLVDQEAEGLRKLNLGRDQILARLWELASLNPEETRGSIAGQIRALSMIVAIEGLIPDRLLSSTRTPPAPPLQPKNAAADWCPSQQQAVATVEAQPSAPRAPAPKPHPRPSDDPLFPELRNDPSPLNPFIYPEKRSPVAPAINYYDVPVNSVGPFQLANPRRVLSVGGR